MPTPDGFVSPAVAIAGAAVTVAGLGPCGCCAGREATERQLPLVSLAAVSASGVYALVAVFEGLVTARVVQGMLALRADLVQVAR